LDRSVYRTFSQLWVPSQHGLILSLWAAQRPTDFRRADRGHLHSVPSAISLRHCSKFRRNSGNALHRGSRRVRAGGHYATTFVVMPQLGLRCIYRIAITRNMYRILNFIARRYASTVYTTIRGPSVCLSVCPSVRPSVTSRCSVQATKLVITQTLSNNAER